MNWRTGIAARRDGLSCAETAARRTKGSSTSETGEFLRQTTQQGYRGDSCWSRGLAWSLYGFGTCYELTNKPVYLEVAEHNAEYWLSNVPADGVAPWDFDAPVDGPLSREQVDTSASAIAVVGLAESGGARFECCASEWRIAIALSEPSTR